MRSTIGKIFSFIFSAGEAIAEAASTGSSLLVSANPISNLAGSGYPVAYSIGMLTALIEGTKTYCFQGAEIRKRFSNEQVNDSDSEDEDEDEDEEASFFGTQDEEALRKLLTITTSRKSVYIFYKYSYLISSTIVDYLSITLLYSAAKAWIQDFQDGEDTPLTFVSQNEGILLLLYYVLFDLPFKFTNEMPQTCKEMLKIMDIPPESAPDHALTQKFLRAVSALAKNDFFRRYTRIIGSIADTFEHIIPLIIIVPNSWILNIANGPTVLAGGMAVSSVLFLATIAGTILAQTYLFEGNFSDENLRSIAIQFGKPIDKETLWLHPKVAKVFHKLLYLGAPLHGVDTGLSILLTLKEVEAPGPVVSIASLCTFIIAAMGNYYSEVKESQHSLRKITKKDLPKITSENFRNLTFFARASHGSIQSDTPGFKEIPLCILDYETPKQPWASSSSA